MFYYRGIMQKINKINGRSLRLLLKNYKDDFQDLLRSFGDISIHQRYINSFTEVYKYIHGSKFTLSCFTQLVFSLHSHQFLILIIYILSLLYKIT